jgi:O-antigen/teichoic acid export membrane protein
LRLLIAGRWFAVSTLATEVFERLDVLLIVALAPIVESGYYFVAVPVAAVLTIAPNALGVFTFNAGADPNRRVPLSLAASVMTGTAVLQILSAIVYSIAMPVLIIAVFKDDFANSIPYALWLLPAAAMKGFLQAADGYLKGRGRPMIGVWSRVFSTLAMIGFLVVAFQWFSEQVENKWLFIPMAACIGQAISLVLISIAVVRDVRQRDRELNLSRSTGEVA